MLNLKFHNIINYCEKNFPDSYKYLSRRLGQSKDTEEKALICIAASTFTCFSIGMVYDSVTYAFSAVYLLLTANLISLLTYVAVLLLYIHGKLAVHTALAILLGAVQANVAVSILYNYAVVIEYNRFMLPHDLFIGFIVCVLASMSLRKSLIYILCLIPLTALATVSAIHFPAFLVQVFPSFSLAFIAPPVLLTYIRMFLWDTFWKKEKLLSEKKSLCRLMGLNEKQWELLIDIVQKPHAQRIQTEKLFGQMQEAIGDRLVVRAKRLLASEELIGQISEKYKFSFTTKEVQLCCLILEDKSITEISRMLYINESSVRANRSRVRKKMKLDKKTNLKAYLLMLLAEEKNSPPKKNQE